MATSSLHLLALSSEQSVSEWSDEHGVLASAFLDAHLSPLASLFPPAGQPTLDWHPDETIAALNDAKRYFIVPDAPEQKSAGQEGDLHEIVFEQLRAEDLKTLQQQTVTYTTNGHGVSVVRYQGAPLLASAPATDSAPAAQSSNPTPATVELLSLIGFCEDTHAHNAELQVFETE